MDACRAVGRQNSAAVLQPNSFLQWACRFLRPPAVTSHRGWVSLPLQKYHVPSKWFFRPQTTHSFPLPLPTHMTGLRPCQTCAPCYPDKSELLLFPQKAESSGVRFGVDAEQSYVQLCLDLACLDLMRRFNKQRPVILNTYQCYRTVRVPSRTVAPA